MGLKRKLDKIIEGYYDIPEDIRVLYDTFMNSEYYSETISYICVHDFFTLMMNNRMPKDPYDYSDDTFYTDSNIISMSANLKTFREVRALLKRFYTFLIDQEFGSFDLLTKKLLKSNSFLTDISNGYTIVKYDFYDAEEWPDQVIFEVNGEYYSFDFIKVKLPYYREVIKKYMRSPSNPKLKTKRTYFHIYIDFLNLLDEDSRGHISVKNIMDFRNMLPEKDTSKFVYLSAISTLLNKLELMDLIDINPNTMKMLKGSNTRSKGNTKAFTKEEIDKMANKAIELAKVEQEKNVRLYECYMLMSYIILYLSKTAMRLTTVLNLKISDLVSEDGGIHYYVCSSKRKNNEKYNISRKVYGYHKEIIQFTSKTREYFKNSDDRLFIIASRNHLDTKTILANDVRQFIRRLEDEVGLDYLGPSGLRNYFMQNASKNIEAQRSNKVAIESLTRHSLNVHYNNYYENNLEEIARNLYGVSIGTEPLETIILDTNKDLKEERKVSNDCGYCNLPECINESKLECLLCHNFVTTPECIQYFEREIQRIDRAIYEQPIEHEKEFLITIKTFLVRNLLALKEREALLCQN